MFFKIGAFKNFHRKGHVCTEGFKDLRLHFYGFYLVILPLGIRSALMKYHIKPLGYNLLLYP